MFVFYLFQASLTLVEGGGGGVENLASHGPVFQFINFLENFLISGNFKRAKIQSVNSDYFCATADQTGRCRLQTLDSAILNALCPHLFFALWLAYSWNSFCGQPLTWGKKGRKGWFNEQVRGSADVPKRHKSKLILSKYSRREVLVENAKRKS